MCQGISGSIGCMMETPDGMSLHPAPRQLKPY
jgi:hypothetical protein